MANSSSPPDRPTVYVVDDDAGVRDSLAWLVASLDVNVRAFESGEAFLAALDPARRGCLVLDVFMPSMDGLELQNILDARGIRLPVIIVTARPERGVAGRALHAGARVVLAKPPRAQALLKAIERCLGQG